MIESAKATGSHRPGVDRVRWPSEEAHAWTRAFLADARSRANVLAVVAYGSAVREVESSADLDLLFVFEGDAPEVDPPPADVDLRGYAIDDVEALLAEGHDVLGWALRLGIVLWQRDGWWDDLAMRWADQLHLPSESAAEERASRALRVSLELEAAGDADAAEEQRLVALTQRARAELIRAGVFPGSRPELPRQLRAIGDAALARDLSDAISRRVA
jgi:hypothetical protein